MSTLPEAVSRFNAISTKIRMVFFTHTHGVTCWARCWRGSDWAYLLLPVPAPPLLFLPSPPLLSLPLPSPGARARGASPPATSGRAQPPAHAPANGRGRPACGPSVWRGERKGAELLGRSCGCGRSLILSFIHS